MGTKNPIGRKAGPGTPPDSDGTRWPYSVARPGGPSTIPAAPASYGPSWLARFEDDYHCVWLGTFEIWIDEFVTPTIRRVEDRDIALGRSFFHPSLKFVRDAAQSVACHRVELAIRIEEPDHSLRLLERLNQSIQQNAVEAAIVPIYAIPVMLVEGVHDRPPLLYQDQDRSGYSRVSNMAPLDIP